MESTLTAEDAPPIEVGGLKSWVRAAESVPLVKHIDALAHEFEKFKK